VRRVRAEARTRSHVERTLLPHPPPHAAGGGLTDSAPLQGPSGVGCVLCTVPKALSHTRTPPTRTTHHHHAGEPWRGRRRKGGRGAAGAGANGRTATGSYTLSGAPLVTRSRGARAEHQRLQGSHSLQAGGVPFARQDSCTSTSTATAWNGGGAHSCPPAAERVGTHWARRHGVTGGMRGRRRRCRRCPPSCASAHAPVRPQHVWQDGAAAEARPRGTHCGESHTRRKDHAAAARAHRLSGRGGGRGAPPAPCPLGNDPTSKNTSWVQLALRLSSSWSHPSTPCKGGWQGSPGKSSRDAPRRSARTPTDPPSGARRRASVCCCPQRLKGRGLQGAAKSPAARRTSAPFPLLQLRQHCPAHAHCHVCCPSARRAGHDAPLGSGEAPAVRLRALARDCVSH
jgi:hypothetical protein